MLRDAIGFKDLLTIIYKSLMFAWKEPIKI